MNKRILENMPTPELDEMLNAELRREIPDGNLVRTIISTLEEREKDQPVKIPPEIQAAWDKFNSKDQRRADRPRPTARSWVIRVTSIAAVVCLLICVVPVKAQAESWWEKLTRWTDSVLEFFTLSEATEPHAEYEFKTDNPGLQKVYDAVVELGVTEPVVPMWIPEGYELDEIKFDSLPDKIKLCAYFTDEQDNLIFEVDILKANTWHEYHKSGGDVSIHECAGVKHNVVRNNDRWIVIWDKERIECIISAESEEDDIYKVIESIYLSIIKREQEMKRITQLIWLLLVLSLVLPVYAQANVEASDYFVKDGCFLNKVSSTKFDVCFDVTGTGRMQEIGASVITVQRSSDGSNWTNMETYTKEDYPEMICANTFTHGSSVAYASVESGYYYRAYVKFYAKNSDGFGEMPRYTSKIKL